MLALSGHTGIPVWSAAEAPGPWGVSGGPAPAADTPRLTHRARLTGSLTVTGGAGPAVSRPNSVPFREEVCPQPKAARAKIKADCREICDSTFRKEHRKTAPARKAGASVSHGPSPGASTRLHGQASQRPSFQKYTMAYVDSLLKASITFRGQRCL